MNPGHIYILQNESFGSHLIKIGMTTREPDVRAREFFIIPVEIAKRVVLNVCQKVNKDFNYSTHELVMINKQTTDCLKDFVDHLPDNVIWIKHSKILASPPGRSSLSDEQKARVEIIAEIFANVYPRTFEEWIKDFSRDYYPEEEIVIWENIAKAFLKIDQVGFLNKEQRNEVFAILLMRSIISASKVLKEFKLEAFSKSAAKEILKGYKAHPMPIKVRSLR